MIDKPRGCPWGCCQASNEGVGVVGNSDGSLFAQLPGIRSACEESHLIRSMRRRQPALWGQKEKAYVQSRGRRLRYPQPRRKTAHPRINRVALSLIICPPLNSVSRRSILGALCCSAALGSLRIPNLSPIFPTETAAPPTAIRIEPIVCLLPRVKSFPCGGVDGRTFKTREDVGRRRESCVPGRFRRLPACLRRRGGR